MDLHIDIKHLTVSEVSSSSGVFSGENYHADWSSVSKTNTGLNLGGDASLSKNCLNMVYDSDYVGSLKTPQEFFGNLKKAVKDE